MDACERSLGSTHFQHAVTKFHIVQLQILALEEDEPIMWNDMTSSLPVADKLVVARISCAVVQFRELP